MVSEVLVAAGYTAHFRAVSDSNDFLCSSQRILGFSAGELG